MHLGQEDVQQTRQFSVLSDHLSLTFALRSFFLKVVSDDLFYNYGYLQPNGVRTNDRPGAACWTVVSHHPTNGLAQLRSLSPLIFFSFSVFTDIGIAAPTGETNWSPSSPNQNRGRVQFNSGVREWALLSRRRSTTDLCLAQTPGSYGTSVFDTHGNDNFGPLSTYWADALGNTYPIHVFYDYEGPYSYPMYANFNLADIPSGHRIVSVSFPFDSRDLRSRLPLDIHPRVHGVGRHHPVDCLAPLIGRGIKSHTLFYFYYTARRSIMFRFTAILIIPLICYPTATVGPKRHRLSS